MRVSMLINDLFQTIQTIQTIQTFQTGQMKNGTV